MPPKRETKKTTEPEVAPVRYEARVGLANDRTGRIYEPGDVVVAGEDFDAEVLEHWAASGRVVRLDV